MHEQNTVNIPDFDDFFTGQARRCLERAVDLALEEDGRDLTSEALFAPEHTLVAEIVAKQAGVAAGLPLAAIVLARLSDANDFHVQLLAAEGERVAPGQRLLRITAPAAVLLRAERVVLNFCCRLSGIATLTAAYVAALKGSSTQLLDTRKTAPALRYPDKYAVLVGGGGNHRLNLEEMLMLKDTHLEAAGSITDAVRTLREKHSPCPPIEVECRTLAEVAEAAGLSVERIMLDNMAPATMAEAVALVGGRAATEISGNVTLENIASLGEIGADFISVGRLTHSAPVLDLSMRVCPPRT